ncbi:hypothetical protein F9B74_09800 [Pelistega sp. NLN82]|uniref:Uncharacterized protein n=1 Tax=Pelistega ratti TaxID=2652177 RepID=A0A6L9Y9W0_9BURK|nr:hypothetical protein [Pelistega ratti]NEN76597.1 hypothetical protein [Pelistega ratti]
MNKMLVYQSQSNKSKGRLSQIADFFVGVIVFLLLKLINIIQKPIQKDISNSLKLAVFLSLIIVFYAIHCIAIQTYKIEIEKIIFIIVLSFLLCFLGRGQFPIWIKVSDFPDLIQIKENNISYLSHRNKQKTIEESLYKILSELYPDNIDTKISEINKLFFKGITLSIVRNVSYYILLPEKIDNQKITYDDIYWFDELMLSKLKEYPFMVNFLSFIPSTVNTRYEILEIKPKYLSTLSIFKGDIYFEKKIEKLKENINIAFPNVLSVAIILDYQKWTKPTHKGYLYCGL